MFLDLDSYRIAQGLDFIEEAFDDYMVLFSTGSAFHSFYAPNLLYPTDGALLGHIAMERE